MGRSCVKFVEWFWDCGQLAVIPTYVQTFQVCARLLSMNPVKLLKSLAGTRETFESGICKSAQKLLDNQPWCKNVQDGSYQRENLGITQ